MFRPPIHPGEILADALDEIGVTGGELAIEHRAAFKEAWHGHFDPEA
jgi:plasmid maintenance system antidote protein VapI